jgi:hypothetical protein
MSPRSHRHLVRQMEPEIRERQADVAVEGPLPAVLGHSLTLGQTLTICCPMRSSSWPPT